MDIDESPRHRRVSAAVYLTEKHKMQTSPRTLAKLACIGGGPKFQKAGKWPIYSEKNLDEYAKSKLSPLVSSTSELAA
jgi:hypothetical protein